MCGGTSAAGQSFQERGRLGREKQSHGPQVIRSQTAWTFKLCVWSVDAQEFITALRGGDVSAQILSEPEMSVPLQTYGVSRLEVKSNETAKKSS